MIYVQYIPKEQLNDETYLLYIHTPFCGTCHLARQILEQIESVLQKQLFFELNASLHPQFMEENKIESVPCLLIKRNGEIKEKIYTFHSISNILYFVTKYLPNLNEIKMNR